MQNELRLLDQSVHVTYPGVIYDLTGYWSAERKSETVLIDVAGRVVKKAGADTYGYVQSAEVVSSGKHTWY